jgi:hypothetical protein
MANSENDPPLADKPKVSSLTDFEIRALKLQKEGKDDELQEEIKTRGLIKEKKEEPAKEEIASGDDMRLYDNIVSTMKNPIPLDQVPAKYRPQIEEGLAMLKSIMDDKEGLKELKKAHDEAFKKTEEEISIKKPVLPPELMREEKEVKKESGDVSTITEEAKNEGPKAKEEPVTSTKDNITFVNDIESSKLDHLRPKEATVPEPDYIPKTAYIPDAAPEQKFSLIDNCPHCGWDLKKSELTDPSDDDKYDFVQSILGSIRFKKSYSMFDGKYTIVFRALTSKESDMAFRQIVLDGQTDFQNRAIAGTDFYWRNLQAYRMTMSLESITSEDYGMLEVPTITEAVIPDFNGKDLQSKMVPYLNYVLDTFLPLESTRAVIGHAYFEFQALCDKLQVMAEAPNFWKAIE